MLERIKYDERERKFLFLRVVQSESGNSTVVSQQTVYTANSVN